MAEEFPGIPADAVGWVTEDQMVEIDRIMIDDLGVTLLQMMENAGRNLARLALDVYRPDRVTVLAGSGGNGGGGLAAARHLANAGVEVGVTLSGPVERLSPAAGHQHAILERLGVAMPGSPPAADVVVDAIIGYSLRGGPRGRTAELIAKATRLGGAVVALDVPSGVDVSTGATPGVAVRADATLTLALPKVGLRGHPLVGALYLADISVPSSAVAQLGVGPAPDFRSGPILRVEEM
jgi:NAD(P)H-hydrate epimerase